MSARCTGEPISWLRLERYHLGEVDEIERAKVADHLASCTACAATYRSLEEEDAVALPPLAVRAPSRAGAKVKASRARIVVMVTGGLALAAAVVLSVGGGWRRGDDNGTEALTRTKGDAVTFSLVRDDDARIDEAGGVFRQGDRFKAVVTCPPSMAATFDLVVYDAAGASFPLAAGRVSCGNGVPLPGAFRLSGSDVEKVCVVWEVGGEVAREALRGGAPPERSLCKTLRTEAAE